MTLFDLFQQEFLKNLQDAAENKGTLKPVYRGRLILVGASGAGKTSTKSSLFDEACPKIHKSTAGADIYGIDITEWVIKGSRNEEYHGTPSTDKTKSMMEDAIISGFQTKKKRPRLERSSQSSRPPAQDTSLVEDLKRDGESVFELQDRLDERIRSAENTDDPDFDFTLWDFAGQFVYYITHQVFLTNKVVYMLVTDLTKSLNDRIPVKLSESSLHEQFLSDEWKAQDFLSFWMNLIHSQEVGHVTSDAKDAGGSEEKNKLSPVIIVGTKKDLLGDPEKESRKRLLQIRKYLEEVAPIASKHIAGMVAVDNKSRRGNKAVDPEIDKLRGMIKKEAMNHFKIENMPVKWLRLELSIKKQKKPTMPLGEVHDTGKTLGLTESEVDEAVAFLHRVGEILYYDMPATRDMVILEIGWLVSLFKILITQSIDFKDDINAPYMASRMVDKLYQHGILQEELVDHVLQCKNRTSDKGVLLATMQKFDILCEKPSDTGSRNCAVYFLPWLLRSDMESTEDVIHPSGSITSGDLYFHFRGNFLPDGLFYRLIVRCLKKWPRSTKLLRHRVRVQVDSKKDRYLVICKESSDIKLTGLTFTPDVICPAAFSKERIFIEKTLEGLIGIYFPGLEQYQVCLKCECGEHTSGKLKLEERDIDDQCIPINEEMSDNVTIFCNLSGRNFERPKASAWYDKRNVDKTSKLSNPRALCLLRTCFFDLSRQLGVDDVKNILLFLKGKQITAQQAEKMTDAFQIFCCLEQQGDISKEDTTLLEEILEQIRRKPLIAEMKRKLGRN